MKTIHEFLISKGVKSNLDSTNILKVKKWMKEYSEYLLEQVAEKAVVTYEEGFGMVAWVNRDSILNIKNEL